eukprot:scaffold3054_cov129-Cylindrotheca_fusiformis.AAC.8
MSSNESLNRIVISKMKLPTSIKVYYFNFPFWRAEVLRAGLYLQDLPFENITDKEELADFKAEGLAPFGAFPVMEVDGEILSQTQACAVYVGKLGDMYPSNEDIFAQAKCDEIINGCTDVTETIATSFRAENLKEAREKLIDPDGGRLHMHMKGLNSIMCKDGSEFACGKDHGLTVADLAVWRLVDWFTWGKLDHIPVDFVMSFPNLKKVYNNVEDNEKIQEYRKEYYPEE